MSNTTLGLDIGPNSIGWALIDESILASGSRIFPEGVDRDQQGGEKSKSQTRRVARGMRRQLARRAKRKRVLQQALVDAGLLPSDEEALEDLLGTNPYELRRRALDEKLDPHEIGRVFLHLNQRRGFLSNRKDKASASEAKGMLAEIGELDEAIQNSDSRTLGEYLAKLDGDFDHAVSTDKQKTRSRHTQRDMYQQEFDAIWDAQQKHHPKLLTNTLRYGSRGKQTYPKPPDSLRKLDTTLSQFGIHGLIFFQRKMYWPKSVVGRCELERSQKRCPRADRAAQRFRLLQEVNNLRLLDRATGEERELDGDERAKLVEYAWGTKQLTFDQIRKKLGFTEAVQFNFERGERDKLQGNETDAALRAAKVLGKKWDKLDDPVKDRIVRVLHEEDREDLALQRLVEDSGLSQQEAERALAVNLPDSYMNYSRMAIDKLLPHLERGLLLMADDVSNSALHAAGYLRPDEREVNQRDALPPSPDLPNPIVRQALVEVRKVVNSVIREFGKPDRIHVELAREAKKSFEQRREIRFDNAKRRQKREQARDAIEKFNSDIKPTRNTVNRYLLWKEQDEFCIYCGQKIGIAQLFNGDADLDHILPRWRSLDDSLANKVVCHRSCNAEKGDQTPREWLEDSNPERYEQMIRVAERLPYNKQRKLQQKDIELNDFVERQLRDTAYISRCVTQYLRCLGVRILCPRGQMTAELRHWWGLNTILDSEGRGEKNRADHRHHAVDALVIALTNEKRLHALANARGKDMPQPWEGFRDDAEQAVLGINVSHRGQTRLAGALHEATLYGPTEKTEATSDQSPLPQRPWAEGWIEDKKTFVRRKPVTGLTNTKHLAKVRDETIRAILKQHLRDRSIDPDHPGKIPGDAFKGENTPRMPSGVPIKKVRMLEESETFRQVSRRRHYQYVKPGNNHHIVYRVTGEPANERWTAEVVTMWDAALRGRNGKPLVDPSETDAGRFLFSLCIGEMFEIDGSDGERLLCVVRKIDQRSKRVNYKLHTDARQAMDINKDNLYLSPAKMQELDARKITVDPIGRIRWAND